MRALLARRSQLPSFTGACRRLPVAGGRRALCTADTFSYAGKLRPGRQSPRRTVPPTVVTPDYASTGVPNQHGSLLPWQQIEVKSAADIQGMRVAGRLAREVLDLAGALVAPGVTTDQIDALVHEEAIARGAYPSPLNCALAPS